MQRHENIGVAGEVARYLDATRTRLGLRNKQSMKVLDLGCKDGKAVTDLCRQGYDAYGIDVSQDSIKRGQEILTRLGYEPERLVLWEDPLENSSLPDSFFHFVYSYEVFEHVRYLEPTVQEIARVTQPGGRGLHIFPGPLRPIEGHLFMPFVHWLPKNRARALAIRMFVSLGVEPHWKEFVDASAREKAEAYFRYSCDKTYYRDFDQWRRAFEQCGLIATEVSAQHPRLVRHAWIRLLSGNNERLLSKIVSTFKTIECLTFNPLSPESKLFTDA
jgi:SAM-dependent methyltransferase